MKYNCNALLTRVAMTAWLCTTWTATAWSQDEPLKEETATPSAAESEQDDAAPEPTPAPVARRKAPKPWNRKTTPATRSEAARLFAEGNRRAENNLPMLAIDSYNAAIKLWRNPVFLFNLAMVEMRTDLLDEAATHFEEALKYGPTPLGDDKATAAARMEEGRKRLNELISQLTEIDVVCNLPDAKVFLGERLLFDSPGRFTGKVKIGAYSLIAAREGFESDIRQGVLAPKQKTRFVLVPKRRVKVRRYSPWLPRGVFGLTIVVSMVAGASHWRARELYREYDRYVIEECGSMEECDAVDIEAVSETRTTGHRWRTAAGIAYLTAGTALIAATALYLANIEREELRTDISDKSGLSLTPTLFPRGGGIQAQVRF